jgi:predicted metalloprotease with PDZ domain
MIGSRIGAGVLLLLCTTTTLAAQRTAAPAKRTPASAPASAPTRSAPLTNLRYDVTFDSASATRRTIKVGLDFDVSGPGPVLLSLPAWTPGAYEISNFARWVSAFSPTANGQPLSWDKLDYDTWRIQPGGAKSVTVTFDYQADSLDNAMAWAKADFAFFNGTNLFLYPEGRGFDFPATVRVHTQDGWRVVTGMPRGQEAGTWHDSNYHDLVDRPFFVGRFDLDSTQVAGHWTRLASYPAGVLSGPTRALLWDQIGKLIPAEAAVYQETPWPDYTIFDVFTKEQGGGSALEHMNSHLGIYNPQFLGTPLLASITAHEIFHAWNVKRLRPVDMWPYHYDRPQETTWLWVSEGITDYYADLAMVRGGVVDSTVFLNLTQGKMNEVDVAPPTALEDASLSTWIGPTDGTRYLYYPKGSLAGFLLDILIRDGSDNKYSLDDVVQMLFRADYKNGKGFTPADWWRTVSRLAGGRSFTDFEAKYVNGREPFPWDDVLPLAGLKLATDTVRAPQVGIGMSQATSGVPVVTQVQPGGVADQAGMRPGDRLIAMGDVALEDSTFNDAFRRSFGKAEGDTLRFKVLRGSDTLTLIGKVRLVNHAEDKLVADSAASPKAARIRASLFRGRGS